MIEVKFKKLRPHAIKPSNAYGNDAGWDLFACEEVFVPLSPPRLTWVPTGIAIALPDGYYGRIVGRSSAVSAGYHVVEGIIDAGYRGEQMGRVIPMWIETSAEYLVIKAGTSICQLIVQEVPPVVFTEVDDLPESLRGEKGYGSSG